MHQGEQRTLSRGNLVCPSEDRVILWEPTRQKLLERRVFRAGSVEAVPETADKFRKDANVMKPPIQKLWTLNTYVVKTRAT